MKPQATLIAIVLLTAGCTPSTGGTSSSAAVGADCTGVLPLREAYVEAERGLAAIQENRQADAASLGEATKSKAASVFDVLPASSREPPSPLRSAIVAAAVNIGAFGDLLASAGEEPITQEELTRYFGTAMQTMGTVEAIATVGWDGAPAACPNIEPVAPALPTLEPMPTLGDVPIPPGSVEAQQAAALAAVQLDEAAGVRFDAGGRIEWLPKGAIGLRNLVLDNATGDDIAIPFDPTVLRWDGSRWELQPCTNADVSDPATGLCGVKNINAQILGPGRHTSADDGRLTFFWPAGVEIPPGTYALVLPMWRGSEDEPDVLPTEGAVAIVAITPDP